MSSVSNGEAPIQRLTFFPRILSRSIPTYFLPLYQALREIIFFFTSQIFKCSREFQRPISQNTLNSRVSTTLSCKKSLKIFLKVPEINILILISLYFFIFFFFFSAFLLDLFFFKSLFPRHFCLFR